MKDTQLIVSGILWVLSATGGFLAGFCLTSGSDLTGGVFSWLTLTMLPLCFGLALVTPRLPWLCPLLAFYAITCGVGADAMTDKTMDRNLWGIEAIYAQALAFPAVAVGGVAGVFLSMRCWRRKATRPRLRDNMRYAAMLLLFATLLGCAQQLEAQQASAPANSRPTGLELQDALARSLPHDAALPSAKPSQEFGSTLTAEGSNWTVTVRWNPGELHRFVTWQEGDDGFSLGIPLRKRNKPFESSWGGVTMIRNGPYQPACVYQRNGSNWHVQMSHEQADFPFEADLRKELEQVMSGQRHVHRALSPDGTMVTFRGPAYSGSDTIHVEIWMLTVNGRKPSLELLKPFLSGNITTELNREIHGTP